MSRKFAPKIVLFSSFAIYLFLSPGVHAWVGKTVVVPFGAPSRGLFKKRLAPRNRSRTMSIGIAGVAVQNLAGSETAAAPSAGAPFSTSLEKAIQQVDSLQADAEKQVTSLISGGGQDVHSALLAVEKANLSFQLMMQVRNKIVDAYQEISRMAF